MNKKIIVVTIAVLALGAGYYYWRQGQAPETVPTETVTRQAVEEIVSVTGELVPVSYADLSFPVVGILDEVAVSEGDVVETGAKIASLDRMIQWSQLKEARLAVLVAEENERLARRGWEDLKPEERAAKKLATRQARENADTAAERLRQYELTAPFSGTITRVEGRVGEVAALGTAVARIAGSSENRIESRVPESDVAKVAVGMMADVTFDAFTSDERFVAEVTEIEPSATVIQGVVSYVVKLRLVQGDDRLREGMTANVDIITAKRESALVVPFRALTKEGGKTYAEVRLADGSFKKTEVSTGLEGEDGTVEIRSGLKEGDVVSIIGRQQ